MNVKVGIDTLSLLILIRPLVSTTVGFQDNS